VPATGNITRRERGRLRRRVRYLRRLRELQLRDLGGLVFDLFRFGEQRDDLVRDKLDTLTATDEELRWAEGVLGEPERERDLRVAGVGGTCPNCGALHSSDARFCSQCGVELGAARASAARRERHHGEPDAEEQERRARERLFAGGDELPPP
jgi:hypothetical protein